MKALTKLFLIGGMIMSVGIISCKGQADVYNSEKNWLNESVPSFSSTFTKYFDHAGFAIDYKDEFETDEVQKGLKKHANTVTMGNEFKPDFIFHNWNIYPEPNTAGTFTDSAGTTISVPTNVPCWDTNLVDKCLTICKNIGTQMRGHVLLWHSQTPAWFFYEDFDTTKELVTPEIMNARLEWYIKDVVTHVQEWEKKNNDGKHIVWAWDVVNEVASDSGEGLRNENSKWYEVYKNFDFIVNAFRFANKYVAPDVELCYNDYGCVYQGKRNVMLEVLDKIIAAKDDETLPTRINAMGMQSHISKNTKVEDFEKAIKDFLAKGIDVQITELDIATEEKYDADELASVYKNYFKMFIKNKKTPTTKGISCVTIWGLDDGNTWLNNDDQIKWHGGVTQYPLLFEKNEHGERICKKAFDAILELAELN